MSHRDLGELEQTILLAILQLSGDVYGVPIVEEVERRSGRSVARAAVYVTLRRLEAKGLISSSLCGSTPERGGRARRCLKLESAGLQMLRNSGRTSEQMSGGLDRAVRG